MTGMLADYGADVVWVERPGGDPLRSQMPAAASAFNRGKRSIVLELNQQEDRQHLMRLVERADVFVESWRPGVAEHLGVNYESLHTLNPRLIYCSVSGFGQDGPHAGTPGYEATVHAVVGSMAVQAGLRDGPVYQGLPFASMGAAYLGAIGVLAALYRRAADGKGRYVETSLFDGALAYQSGSMGENDQSVAALMAMGRDRAPTTEGTRIVTRSFRCADGEYVGIHTGAVGAFGRLMKVLGLDDRIPPSESGLDLGALLEPHQIPILMDEIPDIVASKSRSYWVDELMKADVCAVEHLHPTEAYDTPQVRHNRMIMVVDDPVLGRIRQVARAAKFSSSSRTAFAPAPAVGQHTDAVLGNAAGWPEPSLAAPEADEPEALLNGLRILDLGAYFAGPYSSRLLADFGADVIKLEPVAGDPMRGFTTTFNVAQAGKRSLAANLKDPALGRAIRQLLEWADVVHHNLRPGAAERLGLDYDSVQRINPQAIYLYAPGWGASGPFAMRQSFAPMLSGYAGVTYEVAGKYNLPMPPVAHEDPGNGLLGAVAILLGLLQRQQTGAGCYVENPQLNATMAHTAHIVRTEQGEVIGAEWLDPLQFGIGNFDRLYETSDGWVCLTAPDPTLQAAVCDLLGVSMVENDNVTANALTEAIAKRETTSLLQELQGIGVTAIEPAGHHIHALLNDPEQRRVGRIVEYHDADLGNVREAGRLVRISDAEAPPYRAAPRLGQNSDSILEWLGYDEVEIAQLRAREVVR
jgi:crotonobetainyl-CoA:carnitine CoA-transferase CaiB-like acyl-CoA transferase